MKYRLLLITAFLTLIITPARAGFIGVYDYLSSLTEPFVAQTGAEPWTFRNGDQDGTLMGVYSSNTYGVTGQYAQFGGAAGIGGAQGGTAGTNEAAGIFTHTASTGLTTAVFQADSSFLAQSFVITSELVTNGNLGNGIDLTLRTVVGGNVVDHGTMSIFNTLSGQTIFDFGLAGLQFNAGDKVAVMFSARGTYLYDHGWWDIALHEAGPGAPSVPDHTSTAPLLVGGLLALAALRRRIL
ncbi:MAG: VPDSG-CTERM sorting domain-containing protein [Opitutaceae bacterium]|nr:VPDSG-CTERM sorting domain-containing protein [Opitutaceae bacterium]